MKKQRSRFKNKKFQQRILAVGLFCALFAVLFTMVGTFVLTSNASNHLSEDMISKLVKQVSMNIDNRIGQIQSILYNVTIDTEVIDILRKQCEDKKELSQEDRIVLQNKLAHTQITCQDIHGIYIFDSEGTAYFSPSSPSLSRMYDITTEEWYSELEQTRQYRLMRTHLPQRYITDQTPVVTLVQGLNNLWSSGMMAVILVDIETDIFENVLEPIALSNDYSVLILDENNGLVYSSEELDITGTQTGQLYAQLCSDSDFSGSSDGALKVRLSSGELFVRYTTSTKTGWKTVCAADVNRISGLFPSVYIFSLLFGIIAICITVIYLVCVTKHQFSALDRLKEGMDAVRAGDYSVHVEISSQDEINVLCEAYNEMIDQLNTLINSVSRLEREQQEDKLALAKAELLALQTQINPHFIYNTLETISMMAEINNDEETRRMATALGKLIRISVKGSHIVTVQEELEHVRNYFLIQEIRFDDRFHLEIDIQEDIMSYLVPKLILQPLIENCIYHGLETRPGSGNIKIQGYRKENMILFQVSDNGHGMRQEKVDQLNEQLHRSDSKDVYGGSNLGLINVNQRIRLRFPEEEYGLQVESEENRGTRITVKLPLCVTGDEES